MAFDSKEDLQKICESVISFQKGLENINKYIGQLNAQIEELTTRGAATHTEDVFSEYGNMLDKATAKLKNLAELQNKMLMNNDGLTDQLRQLRQFSSAVKSFDESTGILTQQAELVKDLLLKAEDGFADKIRQLQQACDKVHTMYAPMDNFKQKTDWLNEILTKNNDGLEVQLSQLQQFSVAVQQFVASTDGFNQKADYLNHLLVKSNDSMVEQERQLSQFNVTVQKMENIADKLCQQTDAIGQAAKNGAVHNMSDIADRIEQEDSLPGDSAYHKYTDHDLELLRHEYKKILASGINGSNKINVDAILTDIILLLTNTPLPRAGQEALQRLVVKLAYSKSEALERFGLEIAD